MKKIVSTLLIICLASLMVFAQDDRKPVRHGNHLFDRGRYEESITDYAKAIAVTDSASFAPRYDVASSHFFLALDTVNTPEDKRQTEMEQAAKELARLSEAADTSGFADRYYYNKGTVDLNQQNWQGAIDAFRKVLLMDPCDEDARQSYLYAKDRLQQQQQSQQGDGGGDGQNDQNQDQQDQNQDQNDQNQDQQDQNQQPQPQDQQKNQDQQGQQPQKISPEQAEQMLNAIREKEKDTQEKVREKQVKAYTREKEKNW